MKPKRPPLSINARVLAVACAVLLAPGLFQGCSGCTCEECFAAGVADKTRHEAAVDYVYSAPLARTEEVLEEYLRDRGYEALPAPLERGKTLVVRDRALDVEMRIEVKPAFVGDKYRLVLTDVRQSPLLDGGSERVERRLGDAEWSIASKVDPAFAAATEAKASERTERAKSVGRGCDRGCELGCRACDACLHRAAPPPSGT